ncbi:hypothetical protein Syun_030352 [Stephania yunnanensis]|uniref:FAR1 domain-containing protein n=1 Tax=Stephania yunnanensis TaxID=152371 RepID=A0AAP0HGX2_9MAGN
MEGDSKDLHFVPNETSEQSFEQVDSECDHDEQDSLRLVLQTGGKAMETEPSPMFSGEVPALGMIFETEVLAYDYYNAYARSMGFSIRRSKMVMRKDKTVTRRVFCCSKEGFRCKDPRGDPINPRPVTRTGCKARLGIHLHDEKYVVKEFVEEHNHSLACPFEAHMLRSQRKIQGPPALSIDDVLSYLREEGGMSQDLNMVDGDGNNLLQRWCYEILKKAQEDKKKIRELSVELQRERRQSAMYREQLHKILKEMEDHIYYLSDHVKTVVDDVKELESQGSKELS